MNTGVQNSAQQSRAEAAPVAIVTGASSGIGRAFARLLAADGYDLLLTAEDAEGLAEVASRLEADHGVATVAVAVDLSLPDASDRIFAELSSWGRTANTLINNAGFNVYGRFEDTDLEREFEMIRLHLIAPTVMTKRFLRLRDQSQRNLILNVSSGSVASVHSGRQNVRKVPCPIMQPEPDVKHSDTLVTVPRNLCSVSKTDLPYFLSEPPDDQIGRLKFCPSQLSRIPGFQDFTHPGDLPRKPDAPDATQCNSWV